MPLLRYDIGDVVRMAETRDCACGLASDGPLLERVEGRQSDCTAVNGETVTPLMLDDAIHLALGAAGTLEQWQLVGDTLHVADTKSCESAALAAEAVSKLLGHSSTTITERAYAQLLAPTIRREMLEAFGRVVEASS